MGVLEDLFGGLFGGFAESIGEMFLDAVLLILAVIVLLVLAVLALMGKFTLPKPWGLLFALACIIGIIYLISRGGF